MLNLIKVRVLLPALLAWASVTGSGGDMQRETGIVTAAVLSRSLFLDATARDGVMAVVGERGLILMSRAGTPWQQITAPVEATLTSVYFHDGMLGWAAGHDAVILKTIDGGRHWRQVYHDPGRNSPVLDIWFADEKNGIAIGAYGLYLLTTDGGETWIEDALHVVGQQTVVTAQEATRPGATVENAMEPFDLHLNAIARAGSGNLYIVAEAGHIYRSEDLGRTWQELPSPYNGSFFGLLPLGPDSLLVSGLRGHLYRSDDNGQTWNKIESHTNESLTSVVQLRNGRVILTGMGGMLLTSDDQVSTFAARELGYKHGYATVIESADGGLIIVGDHGIQHWNRKDLGLAYD